VFCSVLVFKKKSFSHRLVVHAYDHSARKAVTKTIKWQRMAFF